MLQSFLRLLLPCCYIFDVVSKIDGYQTQNHHNYLKLFDGVDSKYKENPLHTHVFKESIPMLSSRTDLQREDRARHDYIHEVVFVIRPKNMKELIRILHDVSDPSSANYGQHWTKEEVSDLTSNPEARDTVFSYLNSNGASVTSETLDGEYITANAPIKVWEKIFDTEFFIFHQTLSQQSVRIEKIVRTERYSIPRELYQHVEGVFNTIDVLIDSKGTLPKLHPIPKSMSKSKFKTSDAKLMIPGVITPYGLRTYYNMSVNATGSSKSVQGIFATVGQHYSPADILGSQQELSLPQIPVINVGNHANDTKCIVDSWHCAESNLDLQFIMAMSPYSPTTHYYTDNDFNVWLVEIANLIKPPLVVSISYSGPESTFSVSFVYAFSVQAIKFGTMGITIFVASGDNGANGATLNNYGTSACGYNPDFPPTCPYVTTVGATAGAESQLPEVVSDGNLSHSVTSGGGFSQYFPVPFFQNNVVDKYFALAKIADHTPVAGYATGRGYPDISLTGHYYYTLIGGSWYLLSGTSASSPALAGMFSSLNAARMAVGKGSLGWINPVLYANASIFANDVTSGHNKCSYTKVCCSTGFYAAPGWDPATGIGSFNYGKLQEFLVGLGNVNAAYYPTLSPTSKPSVLPTVSPTRRPTVLPTSRPSVVPSFSPTAKPSPVPTSRPSAIPSASPTAKPSSSPTSRPSAIPSASPTAKPSSSPTCSPSAIPSSSPTRNPSAIPSSTPTTSSPTRNPSAIPSSSPTHNPSAIPSSTPTTSSPTFKPTFSPTATPSTSSPTANPTVAPSMPTYSPSTSLPTRSPTPQPSVNPTYNPSAPPTATPSSSPTSDPSMSPSEIPSAPPTAAPSSSPSSDPSMSPSETPSTQPTATPSSSPTSDPSISPSETPSLSPTSQVNANSTMTRNVSAPSPAPTESYLSKLQVYKTITGITMEQALNESFTKALKRTISDIIFIPLSSVSNITVTSNAPLLGITISYVLTVVSEKSSQWYVATLEKSVENKQFVTSLSSNSGVILADVYDFRFIDFSPTLFPSSSPISVFGQFNKDHNNEIPNAAIGGGVIAGLVMIIGLIGMYFYYVRGFALAKEKHPQIFFENESGPEPYTNGADTIPQMR